MKRWHSGNDHVPGRPDLTGRRRLPRRSGSPSSATTMVFPGLNVARLGAGRDGFAAPPGTGRSACGPISSKVGLCGLDNGLAEGAQLPDLRSFVVAGARDAMRDWEAAPSALFSTAISHSPGLSEFSPVLNSGLFASASRARSLSRELTRLRFTPAPPPLVSFVSTASCGT